MSSNSPKIKRALISVSDKTGVAAFAQELADRGIEILSTGGTANLLKGEGFAVKDVADVTGFPEMMDGRLKTLHPVVHGGLLAVRGNAEHQASQEEHGIGDIDLLVVNLYPFEETVASGADFDTCIENIDIGGPAMIRAAAKNHRSVAVIVEPSDYAKLLGDMDLHGGATCAGFRRSMAQKAYARTAEYDGAISNWMGAVVENKDGKAEGFPRTFSVQYTKAQTMRYGENPHQDAAFYIGGGREASVSTAEQLQGKALSYNNIGDTDAALECVKQFHDEPTCVIVKHANPCGVATGDNLLSAYERAFSTDPESAFGGIIAFNRELDEQTAAQIVERQFVEVIVAPKVSQGAIDAVSAKKNVRLLECGEWPSDPLQRLEFKTVNGGLLVQDADLKLFEKLDVVTKKHPSEAEMTDLLFAWKVCKFVKSNAIIYCKDSMTIGVGAGQMSRVNSARIAAIKAEHAKLEIKGSVVASDAFFPFADGLMAVASAGASAVIQPGGSMRDKEVIEAADEAGIAMVFTGTRHFRH